MKVQLRHQNSWDFLKLRFLTGQIKNEVMKVNLDWWNTCNAFPPIFYFGLICFQGHVFHWRTNVRIPKPRGGYVHIAQTKPPKASRFCAKGRTVHL